MQFDDFLQDDLLYDDDIPREEVTVRIELIIEQVLLGLYNDSKCPPLEMAARSNNSTSLRNGAIRCTTNAVSVREYDRSPICYTRTLRVLSLCHELLVMKTKLTQREAFYRMVDLFKDQDECNKIILDVCALIRVPRICMGIFATGRGRVSGRLQLLEPGSKTLTDCMSCSRLISGDLEFLEGIKLRSDARYILVIEKDAMFERFIAEKLASKIPCILVTGCGFPDIGTRAFTRKLHKELKLPVSCLVDCDPHGMLIWLTYRCGSVRGSLESSRHVLPISWLGLFPYEVQELDGDALRQPFTAADRKCMATVLGHEYVVNNHEVLEQAIMLSDMEYKVELEALGLDMACRYIEQKLVLNCVID